MASLKSPGRDVATLIKCINDLKTEKNIKSRMTHYDNLTQFVIKSNHKDEVLELLHSVAIPVTLEDVSQGNESLILSALGFLGGLLQVMKLPLEKQIAVVEALTAKLKNVQEKNQSRKLMWSMANIQFDDTLPESCLNAMLNAACIFLREKPPVFSLSTVCESLNALRNMGARHRAFCEKNLACIFSAVIPWLFNEADRIRELSIVCLDPFSSEIAQRKLLDPNFQTQLRSKYYGILNQLVAAETPESLKIWSFLIQGFGTELHESVALLNELLKIEESALKSKNPAFRQRALEHWKFIVDCFALNSGVLNNSKRIKLVLVPLKSTDTRTADFSKTKIELWWYLLNKLGHNAIHRFQEVTLPLLNFCFGSQTDKTQVRGTALVFSNIVPLACSVLAGILSPKAEFECTPIDNSTLDRVHLFVSAEDFAKSIDTFSQFSVIGLNLKTAIDPPEIYEGIVRAFVERCCIGNHHETLDTFVYTIMVMAIEKPANMEVIFEALAGTLESPKVVELLLKHLEGLVHWYADNEPLPSHPSVRFLNELLEAGVLWDLRKCSASFMETVEALGRKCGPVTSNIHPLVELWNRFAVVLVASIKKIKLNETDLRVVKAPQHWTALPLNDKLLAPWFTLCSAWAKLDSSVIRAAVNYSHHDEEADVDERSIRATIRALKSELAEHSLPLTLWTKQWINSWIGQAKNKENRARCTDSLVNILLVFAEEANTSEEVELLSKEICDVLQEQSGVKEISEILKDVFSASTKSDSILKLRKQNDTVKIFSSFAVRNTPSRSKQKPKFLDDFVVVPPQEKTKRVLTDHQKEVLRSKRRTSNVPAMYNDLSQSSLQSDSLLESHSNDGHSNIVIVSSCSLIEKEEEALLEPPCPIKTLDSPTDPLLTEQTNKNEPSNSSSIDDIVKNDLKLRSKVSVSVPKVPTTRRSVRLSSNDSIISSDSDGSPAVKVPEAFKRPGPASRKAMMLANQEKAKASAAPVDEKVESAEAQSINEDVPEHVDKENECSAVQPKSVLPFGSPRRVTLQPVIEQKVDSSDSEMVIIPDTVDAHNEYVSKRAEDADSTKQSSEESAETSCDVPKKVGEVAEKTVLNAVDMEVEPGDATMIDDASPEDADVNASSMEITTLSPKVSSEEPRSSVCPMEITLCAERKPSETEQSSVVNNLVALNETSQTESQSQKATQVFPLKNLLKSYVAKKKAPLKMVAPAPCSSKRGAQMLELSRKITRNEPPSKKLKKGDGASGDDGAEGNASLALVGDVLVTPEGSPARTAKWVPRTYSPYASPSTGILKKRQQQSEEGEDGCDSPASSAAKARRVSFADPEVSHSVKISPAKKRLSRARTRRSLISTYANASDEADPETVPRQDLSTVMEASCNMSLSETTMCPAESEPSAKPSETVVADTSMDVSCIEEHATKLNETEKNQPESSDPKMVEIRDSEPPTHATTHSDESFLYPSMIDCEDNIVCFYDLIAERSDCSVIKELAAKMSVQTVGEFCKLPVACFDRLDVDTIKTAVGEYFEKKSSSTSEPPSSQTVDEDADTVPLVTKGIEVETPTPIKSSEDSESTDDVKTPDSCPNGQVIEGDTFEVPLTQNQNDEANKNSINVSPIVSYGGGASEVVMADDSTPDSPTGPPLSNASEAPQDIMSLGSDEVISMIERHPKKDEIILSLLRRHISFSFMLNGKVFPVQE